MEEDAWNHLRVSTDMPCTVLLVSASFPMNTPMINSNNWGEKTPKRTNNCIQGEDILK